MIFGHVAFTTDLSDNGVAYPIVIENLPMVTIRVEDDNVLFTLRLFDSNNEKVLEIVDNELTFSVGVWDATFVGQNLTLRNQPRSLIISIAFTVGPPPLISISRCNLFFMGWNVTLNNAGQLSIVKPDGHHAPRFSGITFQVAGKQGAFLLGSGPSFAKDDFLLGY